MCQLDVATEYVPYHMEKFGFAEPNVEFKKAFMEDLAAVGIPDDYFDCAVLVLSLGANFLRAELLLLKLTFTTH